MLLDPEIGLRQLRQRNRQRALEFETEDAGTVRDVDTPADYAEVNAAPNHVGG
jgi:CTP:molybdopterin cytidylyltransferase MocA